MDTHILSHAGIEPENVALSARLPGEIAEAPHGENDAQPVHAAPAAGDRLPASGPAWSRRCHRLLVGVAAAVIAAVATGAFLISPYNHVYPVPRLALSVRNAAASAGVRLPSSVLAPSADLARVTLPPPQPPVTREHYTPKPKDKELDELLALNANGAIGGPPPATAPQPARSSSGQPEQPATNKAALSSATDGIAPADKADGPAGYVPHEPGSRVAIPASAPASAPAPVAASVPPAPRDVTDTILSSVAPAAAASASLSAPPAATPPAHETQAAIAPAVQIAAAMPADPIAVARDLRPSPMTPSDQVQVLNLVTEMATMLRDLRKQDAQLRSDFSRNSADTAARLGDYERRLAMAEARNAMNAAADVTDRAVPLAAASPTPRTAALPVSLTPVLAVLQTSVASGSAKHYRVQAASPGLALLAEVGRGGGAGAQLEVVVGDTIPDYGLVKSIAQQGTAWVVTTDHGQIK